MGFLQSVRQLVSKGYSDLPVRIPSMEIETKGWEELKSNTVSIVSNANPGTLAPTVSVIQCLNKYRSWIYPCVNLIQRKVSTVPYFLYREVGQPDDEEYDRILQHPVISLLKRPNKYQTGRLFKQVIQMHLDLAGFAIARILRNGAGQPTELHIMNPHELVGIELGNNTNEVIKSFSFSPQFNRYLREKIPYEDALYFHYPHPLNPYLPCSPIQALAHVTDLDLYLQVYEKDFFQNNARPDFVIVPEKAISPEIARRVQEGWNNRFRGPGKQHKAAVLSDNVKIQQLSMSAHDFEFLSLSNWTKEHILAAYATPDAMFGLFDSFNKASSITAETVWAKGCIEPRLFIFEDVINLQLLPLFRSTQGLEFRHESALPKDDEWELAKNQGELTMGLTTVDEVRKKRGQKSYSTPLLKVPWMNGAPVPGEDPEADKLWEKMSMGGAAAAMGGPGTAGGLPPELAAAMGQPSNLPQDQGAMGQLGGRPKGTSLSTLLGESLRVSKPSLSMLLNASRGKRGGLSALIQSHPQMGNIGALLSAERNSPKLASLLTKEIHSYIEESLNEEDRLIFKEYEEMATILDNLEENYQDNAKEFFVQKGVEIADIVSKNFTDFVTKGEMEDINIEKLKEDYKSLSGDFITKAVKAGFDIGYKLVKKQGIDLEDSYDKEAIKSAGIFLDKSADLKVSSTKKALVKIIREGIEEGMPTEEVADMIRERFKEIGTYRANMIARTEMAAAALAGQDASYEKINEDAGQIVVKKSIVWTSLDERGKERVCKECKEKHGETIKDYQTGDVFIEMPIHPQCRCLAKPVVK